MRTHVTITVQGQGRGGAWSGDEFANAEGQQLRAGSQSTWDIYGSYKPIQSLMVTLGVNNVLNKYPPFSNQTYNWPAGYNPVYSSPLLREFYLNLKYDF